MTHSRLTHRRLHHRLLCMPMSPRARCHCQCCHQHPHPHLHPIRIPPSRPRLSSRPRRSHAHRRPMHHHSVTHRHQPMMHQMPWCCQRSSMHCHHHYHCRCCYRLTSRSTRLHQRRSCQSRRTQRLWRLRWHCRMRSAPHPFAQLRLSYRNSHHLLRRSPNCLILLECPHHAQLARAHRR